MDCLRKHIKGANASLVHASSNDGIKETAPTDLCMADAQIDVVDYGLWTFSDYTAGSPDIQSEEHHRHLCGRVVGQGLGLTEPVSWTDKPLRSRINHGIDRVQRRSEVC